MKTITTYKVKILEKKQRRGSMIVDEETIYESEELDRLISANFLFHGIAPTQCMDLSNHPFEKAIDYSYIAQIVEETKDPLGKILKTNEVDYRVVF